MSAVANRPFRCTEVTDVDTDSPADPPPGRLRLVDVAEVVDGRLMTLQVTGHGIRTTLETAGDDISPQSIDRWWDVRAEHIHRTHIFEDGGHLFFAYLSGRIETRLRPSPDHPQPDSVDLHHLPVEIPETVGEMGSEQTGHIDVAVSYKPGPAAQRLLHPCILTLDLPADTSPYLVLPPRRILSPHLA